MWIFGKWSFCLTWWYFLTERARQVASETAADVKFENLLSMPVDLYWQNPDTKQPVFLEEIAAGRTLEQESMENATFEVRAAGAPPERITIGGSGKVKIMTASLGTRIKLVGEFSSLDDLHKGPRWDAILQAQESNCQSTLAGYHDDAAHFCNHGEVFTVKNCMAISKFKMDEAAWRQKMEELHKKRIQDNEDKARELHKFTKIGFTNLDAPADLHLELQEFWRNGRRSRSIQESETWHLDSSLNCRESDTWHLPLTPDLKSRLEEAVRPIVSRWSGVDASKLRRTAVYGLRLYRKDSVLHNHVDKRETHVLSAIWEVGYLGFTKPGEDEGLDHIENWPLEILDHTGKKHFVKNKPGKLTLYESASCAHGRPAKFPGRESASFFIHFAPHGWPEEFNMSTDTQAPAYSTQRGEDMGGDDGSMHVRFLNLLSRDLDLFFVPEEGKDSPEHKERIAPRKSEGQDTYVGHVFELRVAGSDPERIEIQGGGTIRCMMQDGKLILEPRWIHNDNEL